ncbi:MAG: RNA polymerase sigma factor [Planctomycetota bacterium]
MLRNRDEDGLVLLHQLHGVPVRRLLQSKFGAVLDDDELDEAINDALLKAWNAANPFDPERVHASGEPVTAASWFGLIAKRCCLHLVERRRRRPPTLGEANDHAARPDGDDLAARDLMLEVQQGLEKLPPLQAGVLGLDLVNGGPTDGAELAEKLGTTPQSAHVARCRGRRSLGEFLRSLGHSVTSHLTGGSEPRPRARPTGRSSRKVKEKEEEKESRACPASKPGKPRPRPPRSGGSP